MSERLFTEDHEWVEVSEGDCTIGISSHAVEELGEIVYVELPNVGDNIARGDEFGSVESVKTVSGLYAPISGEVIEVNASVVDAPEQINESPFIQGWLIKVKVDPDSDDVSELMSEVDYNTFLEAL